jgi:hypothetical protein
MREKGKLSNGNTTVEVEVEFSNDRAGGTLWPEPANDFILRRLIQPAAPPTLTVEGESFQVAISGEATAADAREGYGFRRIETERRRRKMIPLQRIGHAQSAAPLGPSGGIEDRGGPVDYACGSVNCNAVLISGGELNEPAGQTKYCTVCRGYSVTP